MFAACGWDPSHPFDRDAPPVKEAIGALDGGDARAATDLLETYLSTGQCSDGNIGTPAAVREKSAGSFDLGLALFKVGESFGRRFGDEELDAGLSPEAQSARGAQIDCALKVVQAIAASEQTPSELRARARYLEGNLHFLAGDYEEAVTAYEQALTIVPGVPDGGDAIGRDAAWNRAIALRRIEDKRDAGSDSGNDGSPGDASSDAPGEGGGNDGGGDSGGGGGNDGGGDSGSSPDASPDSGSPPPNNGDAGPPPPPPKSEDDRILDELDHAPTLQQEYGKRQAQQRKVRGTADK